MCLGEAPPHKVFSLNFLQANYHAHGPFSVAVRISLKHILQKFGEHQLL